MRLKAQRVANRGLPFAIDIRGFPSGGGGVTSIFLQSEKFINVDTSGHLLTLFFIMEIQC